MKELNYSFGSGSYLLKKAKDAVLTKEKPTPEEITIAQLINTIAAEHGYLDIYPYLSLNTIDEIVTKTHPQFKLIKIENLSMKEGSMSMEYDFLVVFKNLGDLSKEYGIYLRNIYCLINGEGWDDFVANDGDEVYPIVDVEKEEKIVYKVKK